ncbi:MAG: hypothetical protein EA377_07415 [Phycisphaerales bacterium]|nr:MAG: hypothetical protein EA377_07415 [Phycisphaerales bacterium]
MFAKLLIIIIVAGCTAATLLVNRQHRIDTAHEIAGLHARIVDHEQNLWRLRQEIASRSRPEDIRRALQSFDRHWVSLPNRSRLREPRPEIRLATGGDFRIRDARYEADDAIDEHDLGG